jgi:hypothetical protein
MINLTTYTKQSQKSNKPKKNDDLSRNHHLKVKYRKRLQEEKEAKELIKDFADEPSRPDGSY